MAFKNILLLHPKLLFYKVPIYNELSRFLKSKGYYLYIWSENIDNQHNEIEFLKIEHKKQNFANYKKIISEYSISIVVNILNISEPGMLFYLQTIVYNRIKSIKNVFYGHGMNLKYKNSRIHKLLYNVLYLAFDRIILYSTSERSLFWEINKKKISVANNTLHLVDKDKLKIVETKKELRAKYGIKEKFCILFSGRIQDRKKLSILIDIVVEKKLNENICLVIVGPGLDSTYVEKIKNNNKIYYLGPIYNKKKVNEIFSMCDVFSIPGHIGLGLVEAFFWGLPVVTTNEKFHAPEINYLRNGKNGYIVNIKSELANKINTLFLDEKMYQKMSSNAIATFKNDASITKLINGFYYGIKY